MWVHVDKARMGESGDFQTRLKQALEIDLMKIRSSEVTPKNP